jgi:ankyrin repeat protein
MEIPVKKSSHRIVALALASAAILTLVPLSPADDLADLSLAIRQGNLTVGRALVEKNPALTKTADGSGFTPLHIAATAGRVDIVAYLLDRGADIEARGYDGRSAWHLAESGGRASTVALLAPRGPKLARPSCLRWVGLTSNSRNRERSRGSSPPASFPRRSMKRTSLSGRTTANCVFRESTLTRPAAVCSSCASRTGVGRSPRQPRSSRPTPITKPPAPPRAGNCFSPQKPS